MKKTIIIITISLTLVSIISVMFSITPALAYSADSYIISNEIYYIKNADSGQYLNVDHDVDANGTNILQYWMNGGREEKWKVVYTGSGLYKIVSAYSSGRVLDIAGAGTGNGVNLQLYASNDTSAQRFSLERTTRGTYKILTQCSGYSRVLTTQDASCAAAANVFQWQFNDDGCGNDEWIFEPVYNYSSGLGINYAHENYNSYMATYPDLTGGNYNDCTNFASQCMLAGGIHFQGKWWIYKKNHNYPKPVNGTEFDNSWSVDTMGGFLGFGASSPWISAKQFNNFWSGIVSKTNVYTLSYGLNNQSELYSLPYVIGDVIMILKDNGDGYHAMYITGYQNSDYLMTYHSSNKIDRPLREVMSSFKSAYNDDWQVKFFKMK